MLAAALLLVLAAVLVWPPLARGPTVAVAAVPRNRAAAGSRRLDHAGEAPPRPGTASSVTVGSAADALVLTALALRAGLAPVEALEAVAEEVPAAVGHQLRVVASAHRWGRDAATAWTHVGDAWRPAAMAWQAAERSGAAPSGVVMAAAERMRRQESARVEAAIQRAGVLLVLPLGLCFLPGFIATTVVPVVLHVTRSALGG